MSKKSKNVVSVESPAVLGSSASAVESPAPAKGAKEPKKEKAAKKTTPAKEATPPAKGGKGAKKAEPTPKAPEKATKGGKGAKDAPAETEKEKKERKPRDPSILSAPQIRILLALLASKTPLVGRELAEAAKLDPAAIGQQAGYRDPEINAREVHKYNLLNRGYVTIVVPAAKEDGGSGGRSAYQLTKEGREVAKKLEKEVAKAAK